jgi:hypothetical protein
LLTNWTNKRGRKLKLYNKGRETYEDWFASIFAVLLDIE